MLRRGQAPAQRGHRAFRLTVAAFLWSVGLVLAALMVPVYGDAGTNAGGHGATLVDQNGSGVLVVLAVPVVLTALTWAALHRDCSRESRSARWLARTSIGLLAAFALLTGFSVGLFAVPAVALLVGAARLTPRGNAATAPGQSSPSST